MPPYTAPTIHLARGKPPRRDPPKEPPKPIPIKRDRDKDKDRDERKEKYTPKVITAPTIHLNQEAKDKPEKTGIAAYREKSGILPGVVNVLTSLKTTAVLGTILGGMLGYGALSARLGVSTLSGGGIATITRTATKGFGGASRTLTNQRAFTGKAAKTGIDKIFHTTRDIATRYSTNSKSLALTKSSLLRTGLRAGAVAFIVGAFGTYPFAAWAKQEVLSGLKINSRDARLGGDFETAEAMLQFREEIANSSWWQNIPYVNVISRFEEFFKADKMAIESERKLLENIREGTEFEGETLERKKWEDIGTKNKEEDLAEMKWKAEYYELIRQGKYAEAEALLNSV